MKILIENGLVVDGSGGSVAQADVLVSGDRIEAVAPNLTSEGAEIIDASGKCVVPGFIHMHSHADCSVAMYPNMESTLGQGITTDFAGHCGLGVAPVPEYWIYMFPEKRAFSRVMPEPIGGINPYGFYTLRTDELRDAFEEVYGERLDWTTYGEFLDHLRRRHTGANLALVAGQAHLRLAAMDLDFKRPATEAEIVRMEAMLSEAMDAGALGLGLGLDYQPGLYASREELMRLMKLVARRGGIVTAHTRSRGHAYYAEEISVRSGIEEFLNLGLESGARTHISHIQNAYEDAEDPAAGARRTLELVEGYRARGLDVTWDVIPRHAFGPFHYPMAASMFQPYIEHCGSVERFSALLRTGNYRELIDAEIRAGNHLSRGIFTRFNPKADPDWDTQKVFTAARDASIVGKTIREAAGGGDSLAFLLDLLCEDPFACVIPLGRRPEEAPDRDAFVDHPDASIGLDTWTFDYAASLNADGLPLECGSPATYSGMTHFLYNQRNRPIEETIRKLTGRPAEILRLKDRGLIRPGCAADIVVFDPGMLSGEEFLFDPRRQSDSIDAVIVNGEIAVRGKHHTHALSGKIL